MPFETSTALPRKIAVIGAGISGMGAAHALAKDHRVVLFEAENRLGGHARTKMAGRNMDQAVDTGFIVFNYANYPNLTALFDHLDVPVIKSNMSFGASFSGGQFEYALNNLSALFAQRRNIVSPRFYRMLRDIMRFNKHGLEISQADEALTIGDLLKTLDLGDFFRDHYLLPFSGAIWSTPKEKIMDFPAYALMRFFDNHALLGVTGQHQWYTVKGGSREYVTRLASDMLQRGIDMRLGAAVQGVRRTPFGAEVKAYGGDWENFDEVVFATHSDDTLGMLADATAVERSVLGSIRYQPNKIVLHSDTSIMPKRKRVWSSWIYTEDERRNSQEIDLTYWMNSLQPWLKGEDIMVTLNSKRPIKEELIWDEVTLRHPVYDLEALAAQEAAVAMNGSNRTWFCGAWMKNGFHEDGLSSALDVVHALNAVEHLDMAAE
ncbi:FAD-dependent oxidoreductase [Cognatiyoonia sp. IB215446]|uniref:NAD(P)/FAD-dependent oxidoreductase n=1 Tax=Cognatiyoonia sp. IB215446 TaxID=3097355 RepID=UPI002A0F5A7A|nr:FAD-dependent oxidoreductase [Cognatiyoonia sp. IB215446]MDX8349962.1 FAD-dependent oxidoreductase [Cognatiyoonia sp. IB215446]